MNDEKPNSKNTKTLVLSIIAVIALIAIVGGATFAFFATTRDINGDILFNTQTASTMYSFSAIANETIEFNLSASEMSEANVNENVLKSDSANIYVELSSATDSETTTCTYDIEWVWDSTDKYTESDVTLPHTDGDKTYPYELSITVDGENETDLSKLTWNGNKAIVASGLRIKSISKTPVKLTHNIEVKSYNIPVDQQKLYNKNFRAHLEVVNNSCTSGETIYPYHETCNDGSAACDIAKKYTEDGVGGLYYHDGEGTYTNANLEAKDYSYRYSGLYSYPKASEGYDSYDNIIKKQYNSSTYKNEYTLTYDKTNTLYSTEVDALNKAINDGYLKDDLINNYLCFKEGCTDDEKYRIIGVIDEKLKIIKMTNDGNRAWDDKRSSSDLLTNTWEGSSLETYLNKYISYLNLSDNVIANVKWHVGDIHANIESENAQGIYRAELNSTTTIERKIGLMYISDFMYASEPTYWSVVAGIDKGSTAPLEERKKNDWMIVNQGTEWTISRFDSNRRVFSVYENGNVLYGDVLESSEVRPVFSLSSSVKLKSGVGTYDSPYIITMPESTPEPTPEPEPAPSGTIATDFLTEKVGNTIDLIDNGETYTGTIVDEQDTDGKHYGIRYEGKNPSNYVTFNDELWRIIGVFDEETHGRSGEQLMKIIKADPLFDYYQWDSNNTNNWNNASLKTTLNTNYYNNSNINACSNYGGLGCTPSTLSHLGLKTDTTRNMIQPIYWKIGAFGGYDSYFAKASSMYEKERGTIAAGYEGTTVITTEELPIGLMYPSDYGYAVKAGDCARTIPLNEYDNTNEKCHTENWLHNGKVQWLLTPSSAGDRHAWDVWDDGGAIDSGYGVDYAYTVNPVLYLKSGTKITGGIGTKNSPYKLSL